MVEQDVLFELTDKIIQKDPQGALKLFNEIIDDGKDPGVFLVNLIEHFRNLMVAKVSKADTKLVDLPQEVCDRLFKQSQSLSLEEIFSTFNVLVGTQEMAKRLDSQRIPLEISLVRLAYNSRQAGEKPKITAPKKEEQAPSEKTVKDVAPKDNTPAQAPQEHKSVSLDQVKEAWNNIVNSLAGIKMSVSTYLSEGEPTKVQGNILTVAFPKNYSLYKESLEKKENRALIEKTASELCNAELRINFILAAQAKQEQDARSNPFVKSALEMFGGRVVKEG